MKVLKSIGSRVVAAMKEARAKRVHWADCEQRGW